NGWNIEPVDGKEIAAVRAGFRNLTSMAFLLGFCYFFVQAYLFQILNLKLSNPTQSFSLLLFSFLLGNGLGSLTTKFFRGNLHRHLATVCAAIILASLLTGFVLYPMSKPHLSETGIALLLLLPAFFIGMPFPLLLKMGAEYEDRQAIPLLLGISSVAGVAASVSAIVVSVLSGYKIVFLLGLSGYALLLLAAIVSHRNELKNLTAKS
ncbi:MAG: hypothetical protein KDD14_24375, partial [Saprospiraceae bacterium]|nr:hypothetical protein [Saprospiraceae bacterium]